MRYTLTIMHPKKWEGKRCLLEHEGALLNLGS